MFKHTENEFDRIKRVYDEAWKRKEKEIHKELLDTLKTGKWFSYYGRIWKCEDPPRSQ